MGPQSRVPALRGDPGVPPPENFEIVDAISQLLIIFSASMICTKIVFFADVKTYISDT